MPNYGKNIIIWLVIGILLIALFSMFQGSMEHSGYNQASIFRNSWRRSMQGAGQRRRHPQHVRRHSGAAITGHANGDGNGVVYTQTPEYPGAGR